MKYLQKIFSRHFYRSPLFWGIFFISSYTAGGFILLPNIVKGKIVEQVAANLGWQAEIGKVTFNPYTFSLKINNLSIQDKQDNKVISFSQYHTDFEVRSIIEGAFTFANVELVAPTINLVIDKNGISNIQQALQTQSAKTEKVHDEEINQQTDDVLPKLLFDNIGLVDGEINIVDHSPRNTVEHTINPLNFNLKNFSTHIKNDGDYQLNIELGNGQKILWTGNIGIAPLRSTGSIDISGIRAHKLWDYVAQKSPYDLHHGIAQINANYRFKMTGDTPDFELFDSTVKLQDMQVGLKQNPASFVDISALTIGPLSYSLAKQALQIKSLDIASIDLQIERDQQGQLTFLAPFTQAPTPAIETATAPDSAKNNAGEEFKWSIDSFNINDSNINIVDKVPSIETRLAINEINLNLLGLSQNLAHSLPFFVSYQINDSDDNTVKGEITPQPLDLKVAVSLKNIALNALQPYINDFARINLEQGKLSLAGDISLTLDEQGEAHGSYAGNLGIQDFNTKDQILKQRLVGWQQLSIDPVKINFNPLSIAIDKIVLVEPYSRLIVTKDRSLNFSQLLAEQTNVQQPVAQPQQTADQSTQQPLALTIGEIELTDGNAYFADQSLQPEFATSIQNINGKISGLSADNLERADVNITGTVDNYGKMLVQGKINPLGGELYTDINVKFEKIELATLTPYSGRYAGYVIKKGKLNLDLNYKIAQRKLDGSNRLVLEQFELGETVDSQESLGLPIKLAVALFKDSNGIIDISLPTQGDMDDPEFEIGGLVLKALLNVMTKAVTSPFSMLANLAGGDEQQLNAVAFDVGNDSLSTEQLDNLATLADVLRERPQLILEIHAIVDKESDGFALKQKQLTEQLILNDGNNADQGKRITAMETLLVSLAGEDAVKTIKIELQAEAAESAETAGDEQPAQAESSPVPENDKYEKSLYQALLDSQPLTNQDLNNLAKKRVSIIQEQLIKENKVPENQIFVIRPSLDGSAQEDKVLTTFSLNTQS